MKQLIYFVLLFLLFPVVLAQTIPTLDSYVLDKGDMISDGVEQQLEQVIQAIEQTTTAEIAVLTVESFEGMSKEEYAYEVFEKNAFGKKDVDNGLLLLISKNDREYRVEVGYGLEPYITDAKKVDIGVRIIEYHFKQGNFDEGVLGAVKAIGGLIQGEEDVISQYGSAVGATPKKSLVWTIFTIIMFILIIISFLGRAGIFFFPVPIGGHTGGNSGGFGSSGFGGFGGGSFGGGGFGGSW